MKFITINHEVDLQTIKLNIVFHDCTSLSTLVCSGISLYFHISLPNTEITQLYVSHTTHFFHWLQLIRNVQCLLPLKCLVTLLSVMWF